VRAAPQQIVMLGMRPAHADPQLGYIIPATLASVGAAPVAGFVEKPATPLARQLIARGALWNAFILVFSAPTLLRIYAQRMPGVLGALRQALADPLDPARQLAALYARLPTIDFSRDLLADSATLPLRVLPVAECGWTDLGTPECVARVLAHLPEDTAASAWSQQSGMPVNLAANLHGVARPRWPAPRAVVHS
jgi:mannose-1-phosphate guanylyltransferase